MRAAGRAALEWRAKIFFVPAGVPEKSIMRMCGQIDPQTAAQKYDDQLNAIATESGEPIYQHDLILPGLGDDGHTVSLFPGTAALGEMIRCVIANFVPKLNAWRLTFTCPLMNRARHICFSSERRKIPRMCSQATRNSPLRE